MTLYCFLFARTPFRGSNAYDIYQRVADDPTKEQCGVQRLVYNPTKKHWCYTFW